MSDIKAMYDGNFTTTTTLKNDVSIHYTPKEQMSKMPEGAKVINERKSIDVSEIENGYLVCENKEIEYETKNNEGESERGWCYECRKYYSKEKPFDIKLTY